jgi:hypothetical protein
MKWLRLVCTANISVTRKAAEAFIHGLISAYYSNNTSPRSIYNLPQKNFVRLFVNLDDQNARMVEN